MLPPMQCSSTASKGHPIPTNPEIASSVGDDLAATNLPSHHCLGLAHSRLRGTLSARSQCHPVPAAPGCWSAPESMAVVLVVLR